MIWKPPIADLDREFEESLNRDPDFAKTLAECRRFQQSLDTLLGIEHFDLPSGLKEDSSQEVGDLLTPEEKKKLPLTIGDYRIESELGKGGMGVVYKAWQLSVARWVALKTLARQYLKDPAALARFQREIIAEGKVFHPSICTLYGSGKLRGVPYIAMRYVEGETLAAKLTPARAASQSSITISPTNLLNDLSAQNSEDGDQEVNLAPHASREQLVEAIYFFERTAKALHAAHERGGLVHRDIKPGNIMITADGDPVILDFGLARIEKRAEESLSGDGPVSASIPMGTPLYMSPEQIVAAGASHSLPPYIPPDHKGQVDRRSDIFSLGVTLYESLTLHHPFPGKTREGVFTKILYSEPQDPRMLNRRIPADLKAVVERSLEKDVDKRHGTAMELAEDLRRIRSYEPIPWMHTDRTHHLRLWARRNVLGSLLIFVLFLGLSVSSVLAWLAVKWAVSDGITRKQIEAKRALDQKFYRLDLALLKRSGTWEVFNSQLRAKEERRQDRFPADAEALRFLLYTSDNPKRMYSKFAPTLTYLEKSLSRPIDLTIYSLYKDAVAGLVRHNADFARSGAASYVIATIADPEIKLLAVERKKERTTFKGVVVVLKGSTIKNISDLKRKKIAFGDPYSTIGNYLFKEALLKAGIHAGDVQAKHFHSHEDVANAIIRGSHDAGAIKWSTYDSDRFKNDLRVIETFDSVPTKPWFARSGLDRSVYDVTQRALLQMDNEEVLSELGVIGFVRGSDSLYDGIRDTIKVTEGFGGQARNGDG